MALIRSPWAEYDKERRASAERFNDLSNHLGLAFRAAQQEAYDQWQASHDEALKEASQKDQKNSRS